MFLRSGNSLLIFLYSYHVWVTSKIQEDFQSSTYSGVLVIVSCRFLKFRHHLCFWGQGILWWHSYWATMFERPQKFVMLRHATSCHVMSHHVTSCHVMSRYVTSCHVMPRHVASCHVRPCHVTSRHFMSCHVTSRHVTSCHVMPRHIMSRHVMSRHVTSCHVTSCHVVSRHIMSCHVMSRRKSRDCHMINASLSTDFFHTQLIQVRHNRVRWLSRRVPIPYRISGILSSLINLIKSINLINIINLIN